MLAIGIRYLCGWAMATHPSDRERPEWPPHPDRVFMALAAAHFETDGGQHQRAALQWLERQHAPAIVATRHQVRSAVTSYVPVNDIDLPRPRKSASTAKEPSAGQVKKGLGLLPEHRPRQPRQFPVAIPDLNDTRDVVAYLVWRDTQPTAEILGALCELCRAVTYVGHSASLVQMWVANNPPADNVMTPRPGPARYRLRVMGEGRLAQLEARYKQGLRPAPSLWSGYDHETRETPVALPPYSVFDDALIILQRVGGRSLGLESSLLVTGALRGLVQKMGPQPPPEWISGHQADSSPSQQPHLAMFPLPHVGREHADGHLLGVGIAVPRGINLEEQARCIHSVLFDHVGAPARRKLTMGKAGDWEVEFSEGEDQPIALCPQTWVGPAARWGTVSPIVLDRHSKAKDPASVWVEAEATIADACQRIGLPRPCEVILSPVSMFIGSPHSRGFPALQRKSGGNLHHTHAVLVFDQEILGPVLLGAGRYRGFGLCRPMRSLGGALI